MAVSRASEKGGLREQTDAKMAEWKGCYSAEKMAPCSAY